MENIKGDFRSLLKRFVQGKKESYVDGDYKICVGNKGFTVYVNNKSVLFFDGDKIDGQVIFIGPERYQKMVEIIQEFYPSAWDFYG